jgi:hypothetical protein
MESLAGVFPTAGFFIFRKGGIQLPLALWFQGMYTTRSD